MFFFSTNFLSQYFVIIFLKNSRLEKTVLINMSCKYFITFCALIHTIIGVKLPELQLQTDSNPGICIALHCALESAACVADAACLETLQCMVGCEDRPDVSQCQFECEMTLGINNDVFVTLLQCMARWDPSN